MRIGTPLFILLVSMLLVPLAGCLGDAPTQNVGSPAPADLVVETAQGPKRASTITADDRVEAPSWKLGQWFGVHVWRAGGAEDGRHYDVAVVEETEDAWILAPSDRDAAAEDAAYDLPVVGAFDRDTLATTGYQTDWDLFTFPLHDEKDWHREVAVREPTRWELRTYEVTFSARFAAAIDVQGARYPGFEIVGTLDDGTTLLAFDFVPAIGWYAHLAIYDTSTADVEDALFRMQSMGFGTGWKGTYHAAKATLVMDHWQWFVGFAPTEHQFDPVARFEVPETADTLYGFVVSFALDGANELVLVAPGGGLREYRAVHVGADSEGDTVWDLIDEPALPGLWTVALAGAGVVFAGGLILWTLEESDHAFAAE